MYWFQQAFSYPSNVSMSSPAPCFSIDGWDYKHTNNSFGDWFGKTEQTNSSRENAEAQEKHSTPLLDLAHNDEWREVVKLVDKSNNKAKLLGKQDCDGNLPIHIACQSKTTCTYVLRELIKAAPDTASRVNHQGATPLHSLVQFNSPSDEDLLNVIKAFPGAVAVRDESGRTPLHHATEQNLSLSGLTIIGEQMKNISDALKYITYPCEIVSGRGSKNSPDAEVKTSSVTPLQMVWRNTLTPLNGSEYKAKGKCWDKALLLLKFAFYNKHPSEKFQAIRALYEFLEYVPLDEYDFIYTNMQDRTTAQVKSTDGAEFTLDKYISMERPYEEEADLLDRLLRNHIFLKRNLLSEGPKLLSNKKKSNAPKGQDAHTVNDNRTKKIKMAILAKQGALEVLARLAPLYGTQLKEEDTDKRIPLQIVCRNPSFNLKVLTALVEAWPESPSHIDNEGSTALHFYLFYTLEENIKNGMLRYFLNSYPAALTVRDNFGNTPLHHAIEKGISLSGLKIILEYPGAAKSITLPSKDSRRSRGSLNHHSVYRLSNVGCERTPLCMAWRLVLSPLDLPDFKVKSKRWEIASMLLKVAYNQKYPTSSAKFQPLHALLEFLPFLPSEIYTFIQDLAGCRHFMEARDGCGRLPLHLAVCAEREDRDVARVIDLLLPLHPEAMKINDGSGRLPFHIAVSSKRGENTTMKIIKRLLYHCPDALKSESENLHENGRLSIHEAIRAGQTWNICELLIKTYPEALSAIDRKSGLHPLALSAKEIQSEGVETEGNQLTMIYQLALCNPIPTS